MYEAYIIDMLTEINIDIIGPNVYHVQYGLFIIRLFSLSALLSVSKI